MKATLLIAAAATAAVGYAGPAAADPPPAPVPFMEHDGTYLVGTDIQPGMYLTLGAAGGGDCSWIRRSANGSSDGSNITGIDRGATSGPHYALIEPTDTTFETHGCQRWAIGTLPSTRIPPAGRTCIYPVQGCVDPLTGDGPE